MKAFAVVSLLLFVDVLLASPLAFPKEVTLVEDLPIVEIPQDVDVSDAKHRWVFMPDSEGKLHLVDLNPYEVTIEPLFNAAADIRFLLFTRSNPLVPQVLTFEDVDSIRNSNFNAANPTRFTIHGWNSGPSSGTNLNTAAGYFQRGEFNVITVDWSAGANTINYISARNRTADVGQFLARFIDFLHTNGFINFASLHLIGHSLGAHAAGIAGKSVTRGRVQVIYGLDPAGPLFTVGNPEARINRGDAVYVEIIHSAGNSLGFGDPIGDTDFYPNGGNAQPGCGVDLSGNCAHGRAPLIFAESINSNRFVAIQCTGSISSSGCATNGNTAVVGAEQANYGLTGTFWFATASASPFAQG